MEAIGNYILFESDEEFEDFCVAPYASIKQSDKGTNYCAGDYSDIYKECIKEGKQFVIKDRNSKVYKGSRCLSSFFVFYLAKLKLIRIFAPDKKLKT